MKKKIISIFTILVLLMNIMPMAVVNAANSRLIIEADKTSVQPGDVITYTVYMDLTDEFNALQADLSIPEGLEYDTSSEKMNSETKAKILENSDDGDMASLKEKNLFIIMGDAKTITGKTELCTFKCTVKDIANGNQIVTADASLYKDMGMTEIPLDITPATVTIAKNATGISLNKTATTIEQGKAETLTATVEPTDATDKTVTWVSSDTSVATVDNNGKVTANKKGTATITAKTVNNHSANCTVTVTQPITGIKLNKAKLELEKGATEKLVATVEPSNADGDKTVTWTSSDKSKVAVASDGTVTAVDKGSATITAKTSNGKEAICTVTVGVPLKSISLNETSKTLKKGEDFTLIVTYNPEDTDAEKTVTWKSSNESVATVDSNGKVTVVACVGTATITATATADNTKTATATITAAHKDEQLTLHEAKEATCIAEGNKAYYTCSGCEDWYEDETGRVKITNKDSVKIAIDSTAHDYDEGRTTKEAKCTEPGEKTYTCKNDSKHTKTETIPAKGHKMTKHDAKEATCEEDGNIDYYTCSSCNKIFKDETGVAETTIADTVVKAKGHDWGEWIETIPATKETEGEETRTCNNDSKHKETRTIAKLHDHVLTKTEAKEATCTEEGNIEYYTCSICNKKFSDSEGTNEVDNVVIAVDSNAHDWNEWTTTKEATCTEKGSKTRTCKHNSSHVETEDIDMLAHTLTKVDEVKATCDAEGNKAYYKCSECDKYFEDSTATTEITDKSSVITSALGHDYDEGKVTTEPTCTKDGVKTYTCKNDSSHIRTEVIPAAHKLTKYDEKKATCIEEGNIEYWECSECHKKYSNEQATAEVTDVVLPIDSEAHDWDEWKTTKEATVDEEGSKTRTCKLDSTHTETEKIDRIPYAIERGNGQTHYYDENSGIEIKANGTLDKLVRLLVDNKTELTENDVDLKSGSTIATLKPAFLDTLSEGQHTLTFEYTDGSVDAIFNVAKTATQVPEEETTDTTENSVAEQEKTDTTTTKKSSSPKTGDNIIIWISLLAVSTLGILVTAKLIRKRNK